jgi:hypothetical protein
VVIVLTSDWGRIDQGNAAWETAARSSQINAFPERLDEKHTGTVLCSKPHTFSASCSF